MLSLLKQYLAEEKKWKEAGQPIRSPERMAEIHSICRGCPMFRKDGGIIPTYDQCSICKCNLHESHHLLNKIAWATTRCPKDDPEWIEEEGYGGGL